MSALSESRNPRVDAMSRCQPNKTPLSVVFSTCGLRRDSRRTKEAEGRRAGSHCSASSTSQVQALESSCCRGAPPRNTKGHRQGKTNPRAQRTVLPFFPEKFFLSGVFSPGAQFFSLCRTTSRIFSLVSFSRETGESKSWTPARPMRAVILSRLLIRRAGRVYRHSRSSLSAEGGSISRRRSQTLRNLRLSWLTRYRFPRKNKLKRFGSIRTASWKAASAFAYRFRL
jgi:hypothetical protein